MNKTIISGRFSADPELKHTNSGKSVVSFTLAVDNGKDKSGNKLDPYWIECVAWNKTAEFIGNYCTKGTKATICGRLATRNWEDSHGNKRKSTEVVLDEIEIEWKSKDSAPAEKDTGNDFDVLPNEEDLPF